MSTCSGGLSTWRSEEDNEPLDAEVTVDSQLPDMDAEIQIMFLMTQ